MIEFVISKTAVFLVGISLIICVNAAFDDMNSKMSRDSLAERIGKVAEMLWAIDSSAAPIRTSLGIRDLDIPINSVLIISNGSIMLEWPQGKIGKECPDDLFFAQNNSIELTSADVLIAYSILEEEGKRIFIHSEKVAAISPTA